MMGQEHPCRPNPSPNLDDAEPIVRRAMGLPVEDRLRQILDSNPESLVAQLALQCLRPQPLHWCF